MLIFKNQNVLVEIFLLLKLYLCNHGELCPIISCQIIYNEENVKLKSWNYFIDFLEIILNNSGIFSVSLIGYIST